MTQIPEQSCRKNGFHLFKKMLDEHTSKIFNEEERTILAINLEKGIFNACVKNILSQNNGSRPMYWNASFRNNFYIPTFLHIYSNLNPSNIVGNKNLLPKFLSKEFTIDYLCQEMSAEEMFPERYIEYYQELDEELEKIKRQKQQLENTVGILTCGKCKSNKTTYYQMQTRSAKIGHYSKLLKVFASEVFRFIWIF